MLEWDRLLMIAAGIGAALYSFVVARRMWGEAQQRAAVGLFLLGITAVIVPVAFAILGG